MASLQVHTVLACLQAVRQSSSPLPYAHTASVRMSDPREEEEDDSLNIRASMYHSAMETILRTVDQGLPARDQEEVCVDDVSILSSCGSSKMQANERHRQSPFDATQSLLVASEKQVCAKLSIEAVLLSLNSRGGHSLCACVCVPI